MSRDPEHPTDRQPDPDPSLEPLHEIAAALPPVFLGEERRRVIGDRLEAAARLRLGREQRRRRLVRVGLAAGALGVLLAVGALVVGQGGSARPELAARSGQGAGVKIRTGSGDFQLLPLGERAVGFVGEDSELEVSSTGSPALHLQRGSVRLVVGRRAGEPFVVSTPAAEVLVRGTEFDLVVVGESTEITVVRGEVEVRNGQGRRRLWARESARVRPGQPPRMVMAARGLVQAGLPELIERRRPPGPR